MNTIYLFMYLSFNLPVIHNTCFAEQFYLLSSEEVVSIRDSMELQNKYKLYVLRHCV